MAIIYPLKPKEANENALILVAGYRELSLA
jgi:hypothetical protein